MVMFARADIPDSRLYEFNAEKRDCLLQELLIDILVVLDASCVLSDGMKRKKAAWVGGTGLKDVAASPITEGSVSVHLSKLMLLSRSVAELPGF